LAIKEKTGNRKGISPSGGGAGGGFFRWRRFAICASEYNKFPDYKFSR